MGKLARQAIVAEIGETHTRLAVTDYDRLSIDHYVQFDNNAFSCVTDALAAYIQSTPVATSAIGVAVINGGPATDEDRLHHDLAEQLDWGTSPSRVFKVEALDALALVLPHLTLHDTKLISGQKVEPDTPKAIISVGQALGVTSLTPGDGAWTAHRTHAGSISFAPQTRGEFDIFERIRCATDYVSVENLLSEAGLCHLNELLLESAGQAVRGSPASSIIDAALSGSDAVAAKAVDNFATWLARFAGDIALLYDARGGIYLWGAIPRRMERRLKADLFRAAFEAKGRRSAWLAEIPIFIIRSDDAILKGAALALAGRLD
ncbi:glucokinase (plasmid) [Ensifer adhaerens]|uniref:glucokinase n=1 Tax=Ensifer adhaerens TaxID=106592 RepID=UPI0023A9D0C5|nr:glucokinase [Ensifer adhaerens]WDZ81534.1 glucokinase [Ensifer adhaerens]